MQRDSAGSTVRDQESQLLATMRSLGSCAVAFSAGVDSSLVAKAAVLALGERAVAVTGKSPSLASAELAAAEQVAQQIGIRHVVIETREFQQSAYLQNAPDRCYHCKTELYSQLGNLREQLGVAVMVNGTNADDVGDYRPGLQAADEHEVRSPLVECGFTKEDVRRLAAKWELSVWDKPASPCLSSRVAYGEEVTPARLAMIEQAEAFLKQRGLENVRVRYHRGDLARIEVPLTAVERLVEPGLRTELLTRLTALGFRFVTLDLAGFRSGSLNALVPLEIPPASPSR